MLKKLVLLGGLFIVQSVFAGQAEIDKVLKLANQVKTAAVNSEASDQNLKLAADKLKDVIELLTEQETGNSGSHGSFDLCYEFAYQKYYIVLNSSAAADKAIKACKSGLDLDVLKFLYEKFYIVLSASSAMDQAVVSSDGKLRDKLAMVKFIYEKYYITLNASQAATKAAEGAGRIRKNGLGCVQKLYDSYYITQSASTAMDNAINGCAAQ